jgi:hypothetical protein
VLATRDSTPANELDALLALIVREVVWQATDTGAPPTDHDISWAWHQTTNLVRALNLLSTGGGWQARSYGLTARRASRCARVPPPPGDWAAVESLGVIVTVRPCRGTVRPPLARTTTGRRCDARGSVISPPGRDA